MDNRRSILVLAGSLALLCSAVALKKMLASKESEDSEDSQAEGEAEQPKAEAVAWTKNKWWKRAPSEPYPAIRN